jgi:hypothetical protein
MNRPFLDVVGDLPPPVAGTLAGFIDAVETTLSPNLRSIVLFESAAENRLRATRLLEIAGELVPHPLDVVLERDGAFPPFNQLLDELDRARAALRAGRARRSLQRESAV